MGLRSSSSALHLTSPFRDEIASSSWVAHGARGIVAFLDRYAREADDWERSSIREARFGRSSRGL